MKHASDPPAWKRLLAESLTTAEALGRHFDLHAPSLAPVIRRYPMRINPYFLALLKSPDDPLGRQAIPDPAEFAEAGLEEDPLAEGVQSPVPNLIHRYPDRVLFIVSNHCALYCRHCMRKRRVGEAARVTPETLREGIAYIRATREVRDVILSGGDPLLLTDEALDSLLQALRAIDHVEIIHIHSRVPVTLPQRVTPALIGLLRRFQPIYLNTQFNHPDEITPEAASACGALADGGLPLGCQTVLLRGVNDNAALMRSLMRRLLTIRVRPYYLHHPDPIRGTAHFRVPLREGLAIMAALRGSVSGLGVPQYMIDLPGGGGKIPLLPDYVRGIANGRLTVVDGRGRTFCYPLE